MVELTSRDKKIFDLFSKQIKLILEDSYFSEYRYWDTDLKQHDGDFTFKIKVPRDAFSINSAEDQKADFMKFRINLEKITLEGLYNHQFEGNSRLSTSSKYKVGIDLNRGIKVYGALLFFNPYTREICKSLTKKDSSMSDKVFDAEGDFFKILSKQALVEFVGSRLAIFEAN